MKVSKEDYAHFRKRAYYWRDRLCLHDYEMDVTQEKLADTTEAECRFHHPGKSIVLAITTKYCRPYPVDTKAYVDKLSCHEICEALLSKVRPMIPDALDEQAEQVIHGIIHRLYKAMGETK